MTSMHQQALACRARFLRQERSLRARARRCGKRLCRALQDYQEMCAVLEAHWMRGPDRIHNKWLYTESCILLADHFLKIWVERFDEEVGKQRLK
mgnify:CR=1 FL=1